MPAHSTSISTWLATSSSHSKRSRGRASKHGDRNHEHGDHQGRPKETTPRVRFPCMVVATLAVAMLSATLQLRRGGAPALAIRHWRSPCSPQLYKSLTRAGRSSALSDFSIGVGCRPEPGRVDNSVGKLLATVAAEQSTIIMSMAADGGQLHLGRLAAPLTTTATRGRIYSNGLAKFIF